ncbi:MAG: adenosylcobinamide amidohydrolase [Magnetospirillum sp.]|nr:adenosylcobinamide amidohydrolase [Magnetospirillum sp.]
MTALSAPPVIDLRQPWLRVDLGRRHRVAGWPVVAPADGLARFVTWLQVCDADLPRHVDPDAYFLHRARAEGMPADVGLLTAAEVARFAAHRRALAGGVLTVVATAGLGNGESVIPADAPLPSLSPHRVGTINLLAVLPAPLAPPAMLEAVSIVTQGRTAAVMDLCLRTGDDRPITGTGTDCVVVAAPAGPGAESHCGLHTALGRALGEAAYAATWESASCWLEEQAR